MLLSRRKDEKMGKNKFGARLTKVRTAMPARPRAMPGRPSAMPSAAQRHASAARG
jgi:hypothetical protein